MDNTNTNSENQGENANTEEKAPDAPVFDEKAVLMNRARLLGIEFSNNIGIETLRARIAAKQNEEPAPPEEAAAPAVNALTGEVQAPDSPPKSIRQQLQDEEMRLVRLRITCMDPKKKDLPGEIFTIANEYLGTVSKFVPFGEVTENGYHVPYCIYRMMDERRFLNIRTRKNGPGNTPIIETNWAREFALEILPPLTEQELERLATAQAAAGSIDNVPA